MYYVNTGFSFVSFKQRNNFDLVVPFLYWSQPLTEYILVILRYMWVLIHLLNLLNWSHNLTKYFLSILYQWTIPVELLHSLTGPKLVRSIVWHEGAYSCKADVTKRQRKLKEQSRIDNPQTLATLRTQDTEWTQTKQTQYGKQNRLAMQTYKITGSEHRCPRTVSNS